MENLSEHLDALLLLLTGVNIGMAIYRNDQQKKTNHLLWAVVLMMWSQV